MKRRKTDPAHVPGATYRLQLNHLCTFENARSIVSYLSELGITDLYTSPFLMARPGSMHGYDVTDHARFNPEIGDEESFVGLSEELQKREMSIIADVVPNHMCISHPSNAWWWDVLENGPSSPYARFFDIDWHPPKEELVNKVLLPVLGDQYGRVLENQELRLRFREGSFEVAYYETPLPLPPRSWTMILEPAIGKLRETVDSTDQHLAELESINTALGHLAGITETDDAKIRERLREKEIVRRRLSALLETSPPALAAIQTTIDELNGRPGDPRSFDRLERLLDSAAYRLSFWRVAVDEINYRRFFDINDLAAIRVEDADVFNQAHALVLDLVSKGHIKGLRVDHPDGLYEPEQYFRALQDACKARLGHSSADEENGTRSFYIVAEKILTRNEPLRTGWAIEGTTGYGFANQLNGLFVDRTRQKAFQQLYRRFTGWTESFEDLVSDSKRLILQVAMSSELNVLARKLDRISEQHRWYRDFTLENLRDALREVISAFPAYRSYIRSRDIEVSPEDRRLIQSAIREAKRRNPAISESVFDFIQSVLLLEHPAGLDEAHRAERQLFAMRLQQLTSPVMAKGVEDTGFYRYYPLASLNEVGGDPEHFGVSASVFHRRNLIQRELWPNAMIATSTHDTKRSEDVRARINVLSEMPEEWDRVIRRWRDINHKQKTRVAEVPAPDANEEYLLYQTLVGTWPLGPLNPESHAGYVQRIQAYMEKALHEAKVHTSWISPHLEYEQAVRDFVERILSASADNLFLEDFRAFQAPIANAGMWNSLSQVLLKAAAPGVPDFYQGTELWSLTLVDPDNRNAVDFELRRRLMDSLRAGAEKDTARLVERLVSNPCDGAIKLWVTSRALRHRRENRELFSKGTYMAVNAEGERSEHVVAFARQAGDQMAIAVAGRFFLKLCNRGAPIGTVWENTSLLLPKKIAARRFRDVLTNQIVHADDRRLALKSVFERCPVALLVEA